jgi:hypothetical protein
MNLNIKPHLANATRKLISPLLKLLIFCLIVTVTVLVKQTWHLSYTDYLWGKFFVLCAIVGVVSFVYSAVTGKTFGQRNTNQTPQEQVLPDKERE